MLFRSGPATMNGENRENNARVSQIGEKGDNEDTANDSELLDGLSCAEMFGDKQGRTYKYVSYESEPSKANS